MDEASGLKKELGEEVGVESEAGGVDAERLVIAKVVLVLSLRSFGDQ